MFYKQYESFRTVVQLENKKNYLLFESIMSYPVNECENTKEENSKYTSHVAVSTLYC